MDSVETFHQVEGVVEQNQTDSVKMGLTRMMVVVVEREMFLTDHCCLNEHFDEMREMVAFLVMMLYPSKTEIAMLLMDFEMMEVKDQHWSVEIVYDHLAKRNSVVDVDVAVKVMKENPFSIVAMEMMEENSNPMWIWTERVMEVVVVEMDDVDDHREMEF